jgi:hypothetical protein
MNPTGKIARLPYHIREMLNRYLELPHSGCRLVQWLNSLPEVQAVLNRDFGGHPINARNLRAWKNGGFQDWQDRDRFLSSAIAASGQNQTEWTGKLNQKDEAMLEEMTQKRHGKIARLPCELRDKLNRRIRDGEKGTRLIAWLNSLPEVQAILDRDFGGRSINTVNFTMWRTGGYRDWHLQHEILVKRRALQTLLAKSKPVGRVS